MHRALLRQVFAPLLVLLLFANPVASQPFMAVLSLGAPEPNLAHRLEPNGEAKEVTLPWTYTFATTGAWAAAFPQGSTTVRWQDPVCDSPDVHVSGPQTQEIVFQAAQSTYEGQATWMVQAGEDAEAKRLVKCVLKAHADAAGPLVQETEEVVTVVPVVVEGAACDGNMTASPECPQTTEATELESPGPAIPLLGVAFVALAYAWSRRRIP
jgi:hypothetical protein